MSKNGAWDGRTWIYVRLGHDPRSWRMAGERVAEGTVVWVGGAEAIGRLYELTAGEGQRSGLPAERGGLSLVFAAAAGGELRVLGWELVARLRARGR
jgi:hypothetical protein